jgi:hypothetical protein
MVYKFCAFDTVRMRRYMHTGTPGTGGDLILSLDSNGMTEILTLDQSVPPQESDFLDVRWCPGHAGWRRRRNHY